ncbi:carbohydrate kinase family protein [Georgenia faecalis]|uniref:carbohydrate kinase family protein n=1 Tax=Georgenia faecalis TaxID=2483799 RepID=UPI000FD7F3BD|nr:carbohydrate kinase family protein [Georgenia faecalis]
MKAIVAGIASQDMILPVESFPVPYTRVRSVPHEIVTGVGGVGFSVARTLAALGDEVCLAAPLGEDAAAAAIDAAAFRFGMTTALCSRTLPRTPRAVVLVDPMGRRQINVDLGDAPSALLDPDHLEEPLLTTDVVVLGNIDLCRPLVRMAQAAGVPVMVDLQDVRGVENPDDEDFLAADVVSMCNDRVHGREEEVLLSLRDRSTARLLVMTLGDDGALVLTPELAEPVRVAAYDVGEVSYPSGAGDTFFAALAHYLYAERLAPLAAVRRAVVAAAWVISHPGDPDWLSTEVVDAVADGATDGAPEAQAGAEAGAGDPDRGAAVG